MQFFLYENFVGKIVAYAMRMFAPIGNNVNVDFWADVFPCILVSEAGKGPVHYYSCWCII